MSDVGQSSAAPSAAAADSTIHASIAIDKKPLSVDAQHAVDMESELQKTSAPTTELERGKDIEEETDPQSRYKDVLETKDDMVAQAMVNPEAVTQGHNMLTMHQQFTSMAMSKEQKSKVEGGANGASKESMADFIAKGHSVGLAAHLGLMVVFSAGKGEGVDEQQRQGKVGGGAGGLAAAQNAAVGGSGGNGGVAAMDSQETVGGSAAQTQGQDGTAGTAAAAEQPGVSSDGQLAAMHAFVAKTKVAAEKNGEFSQVLTDYEARMQQPGGNRFSDKEVADFESKRSAAQQAVKGVVDGLANAPILMGGAGRWAAAAIVNSSLEAYNLLKFNAYEDREAGIKFNALGYKQGIDVGKLQKAAYDIEANKEMDQAVVAGVKIATSLIGGVVPCLGQAGGAACDMADHIIAADAAKATGAVKQMEEYARALQSVYSQAADSAKQGSQSENKLMEAILQAIEKLTRTMAQQFSIGVR